MQNFTPTLRRRARALCLLLPALFGCAARSGSSAQKALGDDYRTIAVVQFEAADPAVGQLVADKIERKLAGNGFIIASRNGVARLLKKEPLLLPALLTEPDRAALRRQGISALVVGGLPRYECREHKEWRWTGYAPYQATVSTCTVSVTLTMTDAVSGETLWSAADSHTDSGEKMTARIALEAALSKIERALPVSPKK